MPIERIYKYASNLLNKSVEELKEIVMNNFNRIFAKISDNSEINKYWNFFMTENNIKDWQQKTILLIGEEGIKKLGNAHVLIAGLGE